MLRYGSSLNRNQRGEPGAEREPAAAAVPSAPPPRPAAGEVRPADGGRAMRLTRSAAQQNVQPNVPVLSRLSPALGTRASRAASVTSETCRGTSLIQGLLVNLDARAPYGPIPRGIGHP